MARWKKVHCESSFRIMLRESEQMADVRFGQVVKTTLEALNPASGVVGVSGLMCPPGPADGGAETIAPQFHR